MAFQLSQVVVQRLKLIKTKPMVFFFSFAYGHKFRVHVENQRLEISNTMLRVSELSFYLNSQVETRTTWIQ